MDAAHVLRLLVAGGFVDPAKVEQARAILANCAPAKIPFIDRHIAAGQPPKPAGAVPLPEPGVADADGKSFAYWPDQLRSYGDAREDAGRAVAAVSDHIRRQVGKIDKYRLRMSHNGSYFGEPAGLLKSVVTELAHAVDPIYPDPKPEHDPMGGVTVYTATGTHSAPSAPIPQQPAAEGDDIAVDRFADAMKAKMAAARAKGRGGWEGPTCNAEILSRMLRDHVEKGDPRDVANFCMMLWNRGEAIQASPTPAADAGGVTEDEDGMPVGYSDWYNRQFFGQPVNTARDHACESAWRAALAPEVRHGE